MASFPPSDDTASAPAALGHNNNKMQDSETSVPSAAETPSGSGSVSEEESGSGGWFGIGDLKTLARSLKQSIPPAIDGIADVIHRSALNVAAEFAQMEREAEREASRWREENYREIANEENDEVVLPLPWEKVSEEQNETSYTEVTELKEEVLALSLDESTFLQPYSALDLEEEVSENFVLDDGQIRLIRRLLEIDESLGKMHARLSGRSDLKETIFWKNYFYHCQRLREEMENDDGLKTPATPSPTRSNRRNIIQSPPTSTGSHLSFELVNPVGDMKESQSSGSLLPVEDDASPTQNISMADVVLVGVGEGHLTDLPADASGELDATGLQS